ncbi:MAG: flagellar export protein FliJ [Spirochaetes bacterium]|nr:flagellar export protein FliJ [Spirochaetota bacterium]
MKKFHYNFEKILKLKEFIKKEKEEEFVKISSKIDSLKVKIAQNNFIMMNTKRDSSNPIISLFTTKYFDRLAKENELYEEEIESLMDEFNKKKEEYVQAKIEEEKFKKLKEKKFAIFKNEFFKEEQKFLDEISTQNFINNKKN